MSHPAFNPEANSLVTPVPNLQVARTVDVDLGDPIHSASFPIAVNPARADPATVQPHVTPPASMRQIKVKRVLDYSVGYMNIRLVVKVLQHICSKLAT